MPDTAQGWGFITRTGISPGAAGAWSRERAKKARPRARDRISRPWSISLRLDSSTALIAEPGRIVVEFGEEEVALGLAQLLLGIGDEGRAWRRAAAIFSVEKRAASSSRCLCLILHWLV